MGDKIYRMLKEISKKIDNDEVKLNEIEFYYRMNKGIVVPDIDHNKVVALHPMTEGVYISIFESNKDTLKLKKISDAIIYPSKEVEKYLSAIMERVRSMKKTNIKPSTVVD